MLMQNLVGSYLKRDILITCCDPFYNYRLIGMDDGFPKCEYIHLIPILAHIATFRILIT